jgi:hypothetical protein
MNRQVASGIEIIERENKCASMGFASLRPPHECAVRFAPALSALVALLVLFAASARQTALGQKTGPAPAKDVVKDPSKDNAKAPAKQSAAEPSKASPKAEPREPIERRPYRISFHLACDPSARIDAARRTDLLQQWHALVKRFVGPPWIVAIEPATGPLDSADVVAELPPEAFAGFSSVDKVWVVRVSRSESGPGLALIGREFDTASRRLGALQRRQVNASCDAPRALLEFALDLFNPTAEITGQEGGAAVLKVQGGAITPASPFGAVVTKGKVFIPLRLVSLRDGKVQILRIPFTYLQVESVEGPVARCAIISPMRDPLSKRMARANSLAALGLKPGNTPLKLRFVTKPDLAPAAGYTLTARTVPDGQPRDLGMTDRAGRIVLQPGFADGLVILRLLAGSVEPMVELPIMPGESRPDEQPISFDPKPQTVVLESRIDSLRDEVVDLVALRARLEARMKARLEGEDWNGLDGALKEFSQLTPRDQFAQRLTKLKDDAASEQAQNKKAILTPTAQAQISDLRSMIDRYLDDDTYNAYVDALERAHADSSAKDKAKTKKSAKIAVQKPGGPTATAKTAEPTAPPAAKTAPPQVAPAAAPEGPKPKPAPPKSNVPF